MNADWLDEVKKKDLKRVLFVCLGNICRSPAAEGIMHSIVAANNDEPRWMIDSAGIGGWHVGDLPDRRMRIHARQRDLILDHRCRQVKPSDFTDFDLIIGMDSSNIEDLKELAPDLDSLKKIIPMAQFVDVGKRCDHIPDPYYSGAEGFELVLDLLEDGCCNLYEKLK